MLRRNTLALMLALLVTFGSTACIGRYGLTKEVREWNVKTFDSAWGREVAFFCLIPVYIVGGYIDMFIINSWEFWSGTNPITGQEALADVPYEGD